MQRIILLLITISVSVLSGCVANSQGVDLNLLSKDQVQPVSDVKKELIYERVKQWIAVNFKSAKAVIEYANKKQGTIIGNTIISTVCPTSAFATITDCKYYVSMRIDIKDNKLKIKFFNMSLSAYIGTEKHQNSNVTQEKFDSLKLKLQKFKKSLIKYVRNSGSGEKNW